MAQEAKLTTLTAIFSGSIVSFDAASFVGSSAGERWLLMVPGRHVGAPTV